MFVPCKPFQSSVMFVRKARSLHYSGTPERLIHSDRLLALLTKIRLGWKGLPGTNTSLLGTFVKYSRKKFNHLALITLMTRHPCTPDTLAHQVPLYTRQPSTSGTLVYQAPLYIRHPCLSGTLVHQAPLYIRHPCTISQPRTFVSWLDITRPGH